MASDPQSQGAAIEDYFVEDRTFPPPADFAADALLAGAEIYDEAEADWQGFWARQAATSPGTTSGTPSSTGSCRSPSGSSAAR